ncbi:DUF4265 domain-containing protein [Neolewinella maritima]|uniref:DUF4265 domain-containing protein n=1 Tax=Neolewinella maritima TaxID=1383882 RepID=UPI001EE82E6D|nr:DUF4265 domain-containing protein [Neolewinella maritima]
MEDYSKILFPHDFFEEPGVESAWAKKVNTGYQLDNILFYAKNYALNDIIEVKELGGALYAKDVIRESGHSTIRVLVDDAKKVQSLRAELESMGCASELSNLPTLIAVDVPPTVSYSFVQNYLNQGLQDGEWEYQEAAIATNRKP